jgi:DNA-binding Lrp family transcriptional regulator
MNPDFRRSFKSMARVLGVDEDTARNRAKRLEKIGFVTGWTLMVNPNIIGRHQSGVHFDVPSSVSKKELVSRL